MHKMERSGVLRTVQLSHSSVAKLTDQCPIFSLPERMSPSVSTSQCAVLMTVELGMYRLMSAREFSEVSAMNTGMRRRILKRDSSARPA